jgi:glutamate racemase
MTVQLETENGGLSRIVEALKEEKNMILARMDKKENVVRIYREEDKKLSTSITIKEKEINALKKEYADKMAVEEEERMKLLSLIESRDKNVDALRSELNDEQKEHHKTRNECNDIERN